jgi:hypothetical protein
MDEIEKLRLANERDEKKARELARKRQQRGAKISQLSRKKDTQRKILEGVTALYACAHSEEYRRLHEQFRALALTLPKDRGMFGLPPLSPSLVVNRPAELPAPGAAASHPNNVTHPHGETVGLRKTEDA